MKILLTLLVAVLATGVAFAQHQMPPGMSHEEHLKQLAREEALKRRGAAAMGFDQDATVHHFLLTRDGGAIVVSSRDAADATAVAQVRAHLREIATAFANGEFEKPFAIHGEAAPGVEVLTSRRSAIEYRYVETVEGGRVAIVTADAAALAAIHEFLRYQITEHHTGDPLTISP